MENENRPLDEDLVSSGTKPKIYSKGAIMGFSFFFSPVFGGVLLMQNLKDIGEKKAANRILLISILLTVIAVSIVQVLRFNTNFPTIVINIAGGSLLSNYYYGKYFPNDNEYEKKKIWKALLISILITLPFILALLYA